MAARASKPRVLVRDSDFLKTMRRRFKAANDADADQDIRERADIAFENGEQWPTDILLSRKGQQPINGMPAVPARPTLVIDKVKEPVRQVLNQERQSDMSIEITPADDFGDLGLLPDDDEILLREGLVRRIQRNHQAADARSWAFKRAVIAGRGYYIVRTRYLPGATWDQEIYVDRIFNQTGVKLDPAHEQPDGSDCEWQFMGTWVPWDVFQAEYPQDADGHANALADCSDQEWMGLTETYPDWYRQETEGEPGSRAVRIVDYWYVTRTSQVLHRMEDGTAMADADLPEGATPADSRTVTTKAIQFCKVAGGVLEIERTELPTDDMPIIKILGEEVLPYDEQRRAIGIVRPARGAQMGFNYMVSKQVEVVGLTPIPPLQVDPEAIEGYEDWYKVANTRTLPYLPSRTYDDQGRQLAPPSRPNVDPNILAIAQSMQMFDQAIQSTTAVPDSTLGNVDPTLKSGKAIQSVIANARLSTSNFLDNFMRSMRQEAKVENNLLYPIYGTTPGRLVRILTGSGEAQTRAIGQPPAQPMVNAQQQAQAVKVANLTKDAHFNVSVKLSKSNETRREQFVEMFSQILQADPQQMAVAGDLLYRNMDIPDAQELAKRQRVMLAPPIQALLAQEDGQQASDPGQMRAQLSHLQGQLQQMTQELQQAKSGIATAQLKAQTDLQIAQLEAQNKFQIAAMQVQSVIQQTQAKVQAQMAEASMEAETRKIAAVLDEKVGVMENLTGMAHERAMQATDHQQATTTQLLTQAHDRAQSAQAAVTQQQAAQQQGDLHAAAADQSHQQSLEQQQQSADLQPPPPSAGV